MKIQIINTLVVILLSGNILSAQDLASYYGEGDGIGVLTPFLGKTREVANIAGVKKCLEFDKEEGRFSFLNLQLPGTLDLAKGIFTATIYAQKPEAPIANHKIAFILRQDGEGSTQLALVKPIAQYDEWVTYTFDFSSLEPNAAYNEVSLFFGFNDSDLKATGTKYYLKSVNGPKVETNNVVVVAETSKDGTKINLVVKSSGDIKSVSKKTSFVAIVNGARKVGVKDVEVSDRNIALELDEPVGMGEIIYLAFTKGEVLDSNGKSLLPFREMSVVNTVEPKLDNYFDFALGQGVVSTSKVYVGTYSKNVQDPIVSGAKVGMFTRQSGRFAGMEFDLNGRIEIKQNKKFSLNILVSNSGKALPENRVSLVLRKDGDVKTQLVKIATITAYDQWQEVTFDFSRMQIPEDDYNSLTLFFASPDIDNVAEGVKYYLKGLQGPPIIK
ncbi:hypothetical protein N7E81_01855 [Reichenbachiella carrageenanivorans]|uniref:CBM-cenC domain-containing protein n=1 Tax=Reichenbachiella carrageenanivorans TaxID=2979869 RepID=A0ABY6D272_9BACT|nr:hypothetical protein [Reichenbachiella carrageenanivorans]UXX79849.1 hypothetical protein N7E81_01855 [Reichenbachiella carrageenanivorans]